MNPEWFEYKVENKTVECGCILMVTYYRCGCGCEEEWDIRNIRVFTHCGSNDD